MKPFKNQTSNRGQKMAATLPSYFALLLFILFTTKSHALISTNISNSLDNFIQCYQALTHFSASHTIHTNTSSLYSSILFSSAQNLRFIVSSSPSRTPAIIITPDEEAQVAVTVQCAYTYDVRLRVRSGGHDAEGTSYVVLPDDTSASAFVPFIDVDLGRLRRIDIDAGNRTAWVQVGATMGEVYYRAFTGTGGAAGFPGGTGPTVGVGGHIGAGGGMGPMMRRYGLAADNVVDARVVGTCGWVLDREGMGEEMFWAIRGGGAASFGIVVAYKLKLVDVPRRNQVATLITTRNVLAGTNLNTATVNLLTDWQDVAPNLDDNLNLQVTATASISSQGTTAIRLQFTALFLGNCSTLSNIMDTSFPELRIAPRQCKQNNWLDALVVVNGLNQTEDFLDRTQDFTRGFSFKVKSDFVTSSIAEGDWEKIFTFINNSLRSQTLADQRPVSFIMTMLPMGGAMKDISEGATPFPHRRGNLYSIQYFTGWFGTDDQSTQKHLDLMKSISVFMRSFITSNPRPAYYGYKDIDLGRNKGVLPSYNDSRVWGERYFKGNFERLARVKRKVDAGNYFRSEQSIPPYNSWVGVSASSSSSPASNPLSVTLQCSTDTCICTNKQSL